MRSMGSEEGLSLGNSWQQPVGFHDDSVTPSERRQGGVCPAGTVHAKPGTRGVGMRLNVCPIPFIIGHFCVTLYTVSLTVGSDHPFE